MLDGTSAAPVDTTFVRVHQLFAIFRHFRHAAAKLTLTAERPALAPLGDPPAMAAANQVTGYDPESLRVVSMDTVQTETPLPTEEKYLQNMIRVWRGRKNRAAASRDACAGAAQQQTAARSEHAQGGSAPCAASKRAKRLQWRPQNTPRIEKDDIIVATFGPGQAAAAIRSIIADEASVGLVVWTVLGLKRAEISGRRREATPGYYTAGWGPPAAIPRTPQTLRSESVKCKLSVEPNAVSVRKLGGTPIVVLTFEGTKMPRTVLYSYERLPVCLCKTVPACPLCGTVGHRADAFPRPQAGRCGSCGVQNTSVLLAVSSAEAATQPELPAVPVGSGKPSNRAPHPDPSRRQGIRRFLRPKGGPKKVPAGKPEPKKAQTGSPTSVKSGTQARPAVLKAKDFPPLAPVEPQVSSWRGAVSRPSPTETALQQQTADTVVGSVSTAGHIGHLEALERTTEQLEERVAAALPNQIMSAVRESFLDMFTAALTQTLPEIVAQVSDSLLNAMQPWVSSQIKNSTRCDSPLLKRKTASPQAAEQSGSGPALGGPVRPLTGTAPAFGSSRSPTT
ncbi:hypothetical protein HPB49_006371 [Dermacentor silvarum]|uniref:Uncharacterized protein n=1 Tax=Dermacentor silvarum TaxID=543639 RepID=A0ACB8D308_DERSI|nr:hypothetical protein HPB49_006371 [Dermacentor silvarum]